MCFVLSTLLHSNEGEADVPFKSYLVPATWMPNALQHKANCYNSKP